MIKTEISPLLQKNSHEITAISTMYVMALNHKGASPGSSDIRFYLTLYFNVTYRAYFGHSLDSSRPMGFN